MYVIIIITSTLQPLQHWSLGPRTAMVNERGLQGQPQVKRIRHGAQETPRTNIELHYRTRSLLQPQCPQ